MGVPVCTDPLPGWLALAGGPRLRHPGFSAGRPELAPPCGQGLRAGLVMGEKGRGLVAGTARTSAHGAGARASLGHGWTGAGRWTGAWSGAGGAWFWRRGGAGRGSGRKFPGPGAGRAASPALLREVPPFRLPPGPPVRTRSPRPLIARSWQSLSPPRRAPSGTWACRWRRIQEAGDGGLQERPVAFSGYLPGKRGL